MEMSVIDVQPILLDRQQFVNAQDQFVGRLVDMRDQFAGQRREVRIVEFSRAQKLPRGHLRQHMVGEGPTRVLEALFGRADLVQPLLHRPHEIIEVDEQGFGRGVRDIVGNEVAMMGPDRVIRHVLMAVEPAAVQVLDDRPAHLRPQPLRMTRAELAVDQGDFVARDPPRGDEGVLRIRDRIDPIDQRAGRELVVVEPENVILLDRFRQERHDGFAVRDLVGIDEDRADVIVLEELQRLGLAAEIDGVGRLEPPGAVGLEEIGKPLRASARRDDEPHARMQANDVAPLDRAASNTTFSQLHVGSVGLHRSVSALRACGFRIPVENGNGVLDLPFPVRVAFRFCREE